MTDNVFELDGVWYKKKDTTGESCLGCIAERNSRLCQHLPACHPGGNNGKAVIFVEANNTIKMTLNVSTEALQAELESLQEQIRTLKNDHILEIELLKADYEARITRLAQKMMKGKE